MVTVVGSQGDWRRKVRSDIYILYRVPPQWRVILVRGVTGAVRYDEE